MQLTKTFRHPIHYVNWLRAAQKAALRELRVKPTPSQVIPELSRDNSYYFVFETHCCEVDNAVFWGICAFDADGVILFTRKGQFDVSLWRFRRQGVKRTTAVVEGVIRTTFRRMCVPLMQDDPFIFLGDGFYQCNISWGAYTRICGG